jgi:Mce-associated membrane protein
VVCGLLAGLAAFSGHRAWTDGPVANSAVTDVGGTAELVGQAREGVEKVFSYDFAKLDDSPAAAREFGTAEFPGQYQQVFDQTIRPQAGPQQLRQTATVLDIGVRSINGDTARVMALVQFHAERLTTKQSTDAPGLLALDMARVDGRWKLAKLTPLTAQP